MKKSFSIMLFLFFIIYVYINFSSYLIISKSFFSLPSSFFFPFEMILSLEEKSLCFLFMVSLVTSLVLMYSEFYMEHYNNKKFFFLTLSFFIFMLILSISDSYLLMMIGWDGLGLSSLLLIMFYPGKIPMFNSMMTFFYNRLGDCFMILVMCIMMNNSSLFLSIIQDTETFLCMMLFLLCSFTKSAQFPLSSWLPAAMSAPTPISAMVHSSTLVTAGIFLILKFFFFLENLGLLMFLLFFSSLTFMVGGLLGILELDLKKIVAFSTMSQISMIILFASAGATFLAFAHMIFHALFKTLLFCSCGMVFVWIFSDQLSKVFSMENNSVCFAYFFFVSIFCMSGFPFSSSFFSKDLFLELCLSIKFSYLFLSVMIGSVFTIMYSSKMLSIFSKSYYSFSPAYTKKNMFFIYLFSFSLFTLLIPFMLEFFTFYSIFPAMFSQDSFFILMVITIPLLLNLKIFNFLSFFSIEIMFSKFFTFSMFSKFINKDSFSYHFNDHMVFKPYLLSKNFYFFSNFKSMFLLFLSIFFLFYFL